MCKPRSIELISSVVCHDDAPLFAGRIHNALCIESLWTSCAAMDVRCRCLFRCEITCSWRPPTAVKQKGSSVKHRAEGSATDGLKTSSPGASDEARRNDLAHEGDEHHQAEGHLSHDSTFTGWPRNSHPLHTVIMSANGVHTPSAIPRALDQVA